MGEYVQVGFTIIEWALFVIWVYWFVISLFGFGSPKVAAWQEPTKRFLILVPAHNEEQVIGNLLQNLSSLSYPKHLYDIAVIADNCTDNTALISRMAGAMVIEHTSQPGEPKGKPHAIRYAFDVLKKDLRNYDAFCVFDADNLVSRNYLQEMNNHLHRGDKLIQCYLDTKNPGDNWLSLSYATSYFYMNRSWQLAKDRLGLGNAIGGTGFCVDMNVLQEVGWNANSLTEDLEFQMQCLLRGIPARWCHIAKVYDEKPTDLKSSCIQRLRWARGHWDVCTRYSLPLLWRGITKFDLQAMDGLFYLLNPGKIVVGAITSTFLIFDTFMGVFGLHALFPIYVWLFFLGFNFYYVYYCLFVDSAVKFTKILKGMLFLPIYNGIYIPLFVWAFITKSNKIWTRTDHTRSIGIEQMSTKLQEQNMGA